MKTGELIRRYRKMRTMTQADLAEACGLSDSAIRNYELGNRKPSEAHVKSIAQALEVAQEALLDVDVDSVRKALEYLFRIDEGTGLKPARGAEGDVFLTVDRNSPKAPKLSTALEAWMRQRERLDAGEISQEEYDAWKASFGMSDL